MTTPNQEENEYIAVKDAVMEWFALWSPREQTFTLFAIRHLYPEDGNFLAFDMLSPGSTMISGWEMFSNIWQPFMEQFSFWTFTPRQEIQISISGNVALCTCTADTKGIYKDGRAVEGTVHVTQFWQQQQSKWVIVHEHISGPIRESASN